MAKVSAQPRALRRASVRKPARRAGAAGPVGRTYRIGDYPMHYIAAIQRQNQLNLGQALRGVDVSVPMWRALGALYDHDAQTIGQIAEKTVLDRSSLGRLLEDMAAARLVERQSPPGDRRAVLIRLSAAGRRRFEAAEPIVLNHYRRLLHGISEREFHALMRLLRRLKANTLMMSDVETLEVE